MTASLADGAGKQALHFQNEIILSLKVTMGDEWS